MRSSLAGAVTSVLAAALAIQIAVVPSTPAAAEPYSGGDGGRPAAMPAPMTTSPGPSPSSPTAPTPSLTTPVPAGACTATYQVISSWPEGFYAQVDVRNNSGSHTVGWSVVWRYLHGQRITHLWGGILRQEGDRVGVGHADWNGVLAPGGTTSFGFIGGWTESNPTPNIITCTAWFR
ncbi:cellulose binding domain-containing protein [Micromonospora sp. KC213]|uniref:cellulose binding domain-containing protein n=1 Tax=Micromonospora sp. KC213 TaxID=2530378 RepID=UPI001053C87A|nr:cellulose binding domain-containing protein [Micromonospora sp. KC213]TDC29300.1 hypothetical protein E1166_30050 [Micromonospora sp. KC213]